MTEKKLDVNDTVRVDGERATVVKTFERGQTIVVQFEDGRKLSVHTDRVERATARKTEKRTQKKQVPSDLSSVDELADVLQEAADASREAQQELGADE